MCAEMDYYNERCVIMEEYVRVKIEIIEFDTEDVITTSQTGTQEDYVQTVSGNDLPDDWTGN